MNKVKRLSKLFGILSITWLPVTHAGLVNILNAGFEDVSGQTIFNEFTFGVPADWSLYDPNNITGSSGVFLGTLEPNGTDFFDSTAPEGDKVAILFNSSERGQGEYGISQTLTETLEANKNYNLSVEVGNIGSGFAENNQFFNLDGFPGYRIDLLAGNTVIASDNNTLANSIPEREFRTASVSFATDNSHALLGQALSIRLVNLNQIPAGISGNPDLEVDFDDVQLDVSAIPLPASLWLMISGLIVLAARTNTSPRPFSLQKQ